MRRNRDSRLFKPLKIREVMFSNRIFVSPMCQYSSQEGHATLWHLVHLGSRAVGGAGLVMTEATAVLPDGRISPHDLGIWSDAHLEQLSPITAFIKSQGSVPGMQLAHAGRKASTGRPWEGGKPLSRNEGGWKPVAPSALAFGTGYPVPTELDQEGIHHVIAAFKKAAYRACQAGFKVLEIHAAHGYLLHEFLSPLANHRTDGYGGSFENRIVLLSQVVKAVREVWPEEYPLFARISATDWVEDGWDIDQSVHLAHVLRNLGVDLIDCSSGGIIPGVTVPMQSGYQTPFSKKIRKEAEILTGAVGLITSPSQGENILKSEKADVIFLAREMLRDPYWPLHAAETVGVKGSWPAQYLRAAPEGASDRSPLN